MCVCVCVCVLLCTLKTMVVIRFVCISAKISFLSLCLSTVSSVDCSNSFLSVILYSIVLEGVFLGVGEGERGRHC